MDPRFPTYPVRYPGYIQIWQATPENPYPMNFTQAPSFGHQVIVNYEGLPNLQCLSPVRGPFMFPVRSPIVYPRTHSVLDPYQRAYLNYGYCPRKRFG